MKRGVFISVVMLALLMLGAHALAGEGNAEATVSISGTSARTSADLSTGWKSVYCTTATHYRTGTSSVVAVTTDLTLPVSVAWELYIANAERRLAFVTDGATGTCTIHPMEVGPTGMPPAHASTSVNGAAITPSSVTTSALTVNGASTLNGDLYVFGDAGISNNLGVDGYAALRGDAGTNTLATTGDLYTVNQASQMRFGGPTGPGFTYGGATTIQGAGSTAFASPGLLAAQGNFTVAGTISNAGSGSGCSSHATAVCLDDTAGTCWTDGAGSTVGCLNTDGSITSGMIYDWSNATSISTLVASGAVAVADFGSTGAASTIIAIRWMPQVIGVGAGNFVTKYCGDAACAGTTYGTCTAACTGAVGTAVSCTINTAAMARSVTPFLKITTACATTNPVGVFVAHHTQP